ncbi:tyrosine recombinase XerC [mine drainage metagenome]|uniref:Tyrosine recombinase XerC n=1 Tax=mine drainage metagenome TaxID=410659 RepID=A0A1J5QXX2_9ZZZZ
MSTYYDKPRKAYRWKFDRIVDGVQVRRTKLLPRSWSPAEVDAFDAQETARVYAELAGVAKKEPEQSPLIQEAIAWYLKEKKHLKSYKKAAEHLAAIAWAYKDKRFADLPSIADEVTEAYVEDGYKPATAKQRLSLLKAACRWGWKKHEMGDHNPAEKMSLPEVNNQRHVYIDRGQMLSIARKCKHHGTRVAIRTGFYTGWRLGELYRLYVDPRRDLLILPDSKNGKPRALPVPRRLQTIVRLGLLPLTINRSTLQKDRREARAAVGLEHVTFHDLRHSAASEMINAGVGLHTVGKVLGHKDPRSTDRYAHLEVDTLGEALDKIGVARKRTRTPRTPQKTKDAEAS